MNRKLMICLASLLIFVIALVILKSIPDKSIMVGPGGIVRSDDYIRIKNRETNLWLTYVTSQEPKDKLQSILFGLWGYEKTSRDFSSYTLSPNDEKAIAAVTLDEMKHNVIKAAYSHLGIASDESIPLIYVHHVLENGLPIFKDNDVIVSINSQSGLTAYDFAEYIDTLREGENVSVTIERDGLTQEVTFKMSNDLKSTNYPLGLYIRDYFAFTDIEEDAILDVRLSKDFMGNSAGFMLTLSLIEQFDPKLNLAQGKLVAGTGAIGRNGEAQKIKDLRLKIKTAREQGADIFLFPESQLDEIQQVETSEMLLLPVKNIQDAINKLDGK
ncbi:peptidase S16 lon domain protein [Paenibacillus alvei]|uniref:Peptidase S16 lon domain protein n=1 Tax=Paenibacillus alvei TaxID=44250 RepID=A0ABT4H2H8_PAEAL|nr:peptidase S16 lon domain protein [Paenibacillus alvei]MCY9763186.1 peptidase S16 lon domain protein [Paenibacillus alvei]MCY9769525.1 peptidase S16 lon domain protein [Paenibacillus alvei]